MEEVTVVGATPWEVTRWEVMRWVATPAAAADVTLPAGAVTVADTLTAVATAIMETTAITMDAATILRARSLAV
jgi:hypothetical protein